jgi:hypothetical protein
LQPAELNWTPDRRHQQQWKQVARTVSQSGIGVVKPTATDTAKPFGLGAAPTFFWGGKTARATIIVSFDQRLILMGVWRDLLFGRSHR